MTEEQILKRIKSRREELGLSCEEVAAKAGMARQNVWKVENGRNSPTLTTLMPICRALGLDISVTRKLGE